jgi:hypothetical protein
MHLLGGDSFMRRTGYMIKFFTYLKRESKHLKFQDVFHVQFESVELEFSGTLFKFHEIPPATHVWIRTLPMTRHRKRKRKGNATIAVIGGVSSNP